MCKIKIQNIGAIKNVDLNVRRFTMVIGPESSGKSTIAKLLCHCEWVEKRTYTNPENIGQFENDFIENLQEYHHMDDYIEESSYLQYVGACVTITLKNKSVKINLNSVSQESYLYPKVCYIPSERNFAAAVQNLKKYNESNDNIMYFLYDWDTARKFIKNFEFKGILSHDLVYQYDQSSKEDLIIDGNIPLRLRNASSGVQSVVPLITTIEYELTGIFSRIHPLSLEQKEQGESILNVLAELRQYLNETGEGDLNKEHVKELMDKMLQTPTAGMFLNDIEAFSENMSRKFFYSCTNLFIEEPEQNIFPQSQERLLYWIVSKVLNGDRTHSAFITTHSPFLLFALNNCLMGNVVGDKLPVAISDNLRSKSAWAGKDLISVYELHNGELRSIQDQDGLLIDNYLNKAYKQISSEYLKMLSYYGD